MDVNLSTFHEIKFLNKYRKNLCCHNSFYPLISIKYIRNKVKEEDLGRERRRRKMRQSENYEIGCT